MRMMEDREAINNIKRGVNNNKMLKKVKKQFRCSRVPQRRF